STPSLLSSSAPALTLVVTPTIAALTTSEDVTSAALETRPGKLNGDVNANGNGLKDHNEAKQHAAELNAAKAAAATHQAAKFDKQKDKRLNINKGGNKNGGKGGNFGFDRRSPEGFGSDLGGMGKCASGSCNSFGIGSGKGVEFGFDDFEIGSGKGGDFGFNKSGGSKLGDDGGLYYRRSAALYGYGKGGKAGKDGNEGCGKGGGYDKDLKKHIQICNYLDKADKIKETAHIDSTAKLDAAAAQKAAHKAKSEAEGKKKHELKKDHGKGCDFI
ncbi:hypothetical protein OC844_007933, partial [Tilletia horrida]